MSDFYSFDTVNSIPVYLLIATPKVNYLFVLIFDYDFEDDIFSGELIQLTIFLWNVIEIFK